jgi:hypothetical protein
MIPLVRSRISASYEGSKLQNDRLLFVDTSKIAVNQ